MWNKVFFFLFKINHKKFDPEWTIDRYAFESRNIEMITSEVTKNQMSNLLDHNLLTDSQSGFRPQHPPMIAITLLCDDDILHNIELTCTVFFRPKKSV